MMAVVAVMAVVLVVVNITRNSYHIVKYSRKQLNPIHLAPWSRSVRS